MANLEQRVGLVKVGIFALVIEAAMQHARVRFCRASIGFAHLVRFLTENNGGHCAL